MLCLNLLLSHVLEHIFSGGPVFIYHKSYCPSIILKSIFIFYLPSITFILQYTFFSLHRVTNNISQAARWVSIFHSNLRGLAPVCPGAADSCNSSLPSVISNGVNSFMSINNFGWTVQNWLFWYLEFSSHPAISPANVLSPSSILIYNKDITLDKNKYLKLKRKLITFTTACYLFKIKGQQMFYVLMSFIKWVDGPLS